MSYIPPPIASKAFPDAVIVNRDGKHLGEFDPITGEQVKSADPSRRIEP